jgi:hypothetical protein
MKTHLNQTKYEMSLAVVSLAKEVERLKTENVEQRKIIDRLIHEPDQLHATGSKPLYETEESSLFKV